jgi:hypothetical protein
MLRQNKHFDIRISFEDISHCVVNILTSLHSEDNLVLNSIYKIGPSSAILLVIIFCEYFRFY